MTNPLVSVVIPYYNGAEFVNEAVSSALNQSYKNLEVILVDDGSTDKTSQKVFDNLQDSRLKKFRTLNQGLPSARNTAISLSFGKYILPLDCDDVISNTYVENAVHELELNDNVGIVYSHACFIGDVNQYWDLPEFEKISFLINNCIFCSALFRREDWKTVGGYKADMIYGLEDYDFWLSLIELDREVIRLPDIHFFYRKHGISMISNVNQERIHYSYLKIINRHKNLYNENILGFIVRINELQNKLKNSSTK